MDVLVMVEEGPDPSPVLARVDSVPATHAPERRARDVVTLYGTPSSDSLALALAAVVESRRSADGEEGCFRHLGVWPDRGAVGDTAWRDRDTGEMRTVDLDIPFDVLSNTASRLTSQCGRVIQRLVAGLAMPDWPEGMWRAISISFNPEPLPAVAGNGMSADAMLASVREAERFTYEYEGD
jgi:hypothetical protein